MVSLSSLVVVVLRAVRCASSRILCPFLARGVHESSTLLRSIRVRQVNPLSTYLCVPAVIEQDEYAEMEGAEPCEFSAVLALAQLNIVRRPVRSRWEHGTLFAHYTGASPRSAGFVGIMEGPWRGFTSL